MLSRRSTLRRAAIPVVAVVVALTSIGLPSVRPEAVPAAVPRISEMPDSFGFALRYAGIGAEGVDLIWRGRVAGGVPGQVTLRMEYAGTAHGRGHLIWPVKAWLFFSADDYRNSFAAELSGRVNWSSGEMRVTGLVSDGIRLDTPVEHVLQLGPSGIEGQASVKFFPRLALGPRLALAENGDSQW